MVKIKCHQPFSFSKPFSAHKSSATSASNPSASKTCCSSSSRPQHPSCASTLQPLLAHPSSSSTSTSSSSSSSKTNKTTALASSNSTTAQRVFTSMPVDPSRQLDDIPWHQRRKIFWPFHLFNMHSLAQYRYTGMGRKRPSFSISSSRSFQKVSQRHQFKFLTALLITIPFALAVLFTVDIRSRVVSTVQRQQVSSSSHPSTASGTPPGSVSELHSTDKADRDNVDHVQQNSPVSASDTTHSLTTDKSDTPDRYSASSISHQDIESPSDHATTNFPTSSVTTTTSTTTEQSSTAATTVSDAVDSSSSHSDSSNNIQSLDLKPSDQKVDKQNQISVDDNGIPPRSLSKDHPDHQALESIRARTQLTPRWPPSATALSQQLRTYGPAYSSILVSHKLKVVYLPVFKVATTSMMWNIAFLENNPTIMEAHRRGDVGEMMKIVHDMSSAAWYNHTVFELNHQELSTILDDPEYLKFGFVRNPYDRIVSAYVDKVVRPEIGHEEYQDQMYSLFGNDMAMRQRVNHTRPTFREFLDAVKKVMAMPRAPSGWEIHPIRRDIHWRPQVELIHPDLVHLDFVGHFDRMEEDRQVIISWMHRHTDRRLPPSSTARLHSSDPSFKKSLFETLRRDEELRNLLLTIYADDFSRFHFSTEVPTLD